MVIVTAWRPPPHDAWYPVMDALSHGACPSLRRFLFRYHEREDQLVQHLVKVISGGHLRGLQDLNLAGNSFNDHDITSIARALETGALPKLTSLAWTSMRWVGLLPLPLLQ